MNVIFVCRFFICTIIMSDNVYVVVCASDFGEKLVNIIGVYKTYASAEAICDKMNEEADKNQTETPPYKCCWFSIWETKMAAE